MIRCYETQYGIEKKKHLLCDGVLAVARGVRETAGGADRGVGGGAVFPPDGHAGHGASRCA